MGCNAIPAASAPPRDLGIDQQAALADGKVTREEYRSVLERTRDCLGERGFDTTAVRELPDGIRLDFGVDEGDVAEDLMWKAWDECRELHSYLAEVAYFAAQVRPANEATALKDELIACLRAAGIEGVDPSMSDGVIADAIAGQSGDVTAWACRERFLIVTGQAKPRPPQPNAFASPHP